MLNQVSELQEIGVAHSYFTEPELEGAVSAIVFIANERDYNPGARPQTQLGAYLSKFKLA